MSAKEQATTSLVYEFEIEIAAAPEAVWDSLTKEANAWWLADFHMVGPDSIVTLDARAGGQLLERTESGGSLLWYTVVMCEPGRSLHLVGHVAPDWGGPATTMLGLKLQAKGDATVLKVQDALFGRVSAATAGSLEAGWKQLFGDGLKAFVEGAG